MTHASDRASTPRRRRPIRRTVWIVVLAGLALLVIAVAWVAVTGLLARRDVNALRANLPKLEADLAAGNETGASQLVTTMQHEAHAGHARTSGPAWWAFSRIPKAGTPLKTVRDGTGIVDDLATTALPPALRAGQALDPAKLRSSPGAVDPARLSAATGPLRAAVQAAGNVQTAAHGLPGNTWFGPANSGRDELVNDIDRLHDGLGDLTQAAQLLPAQLGQHGTQRYFVAFQTEAESRGLGGLPGDYAILQASNGRLSFTRFGPDDDLGGAHAHVHLGSQFNDRYVDGWDSLNDIRNSDVTPNFPSVAQIWMSMWQSKFHQHLDGAIATDPTALSYLIAATGPVKLPNGQQLTSNNAVQFFESSIYQQFSGNISQRKAFQVQAAKSVASDVIHQPGGDLLNSAKGLKRAVDERRFVVYTNDTTTEQALAPQPIGGTIPVTTRPYVGLVVNNAGGNKLDYYLDRSVTYSRSSCAAGPATVTAVLHSAAPTSGLPAYVKGDGSDELEVALYSTEHSDVGKVTVNGKSAYVNANTESGHPVTAAEIAIKPGKTTTVVFHLHEPAATGPIQTLVQPLVRPLTLSLHSPVCPTTG